MFSAADKTLRAAPAVQQKAANPGFFKKAGEEPFFGTRDQPQFFSSPIQAKLTVSTPDDPHEKEADAMADKVMRMPEPPVTTTPPPGMEAGNEEKKLDRKEEEKQNRQHTPAEPLHLHASPELQRLHTKPATPVPTAHLAVLHRSVTAGSDNAPHTISLYPSDVMRQSGRGPPAGSIPFEQSLQSSRGTGSPLSSGTRQFMESRFGADFSGVRIHTGTAAESMSSQVHAQAFAHGKDIYFNQGKYSPDTTGGKTLLAHELTHTIQQAPDLQRRPLNPGRISRKENDPSSHHKKRPASSEETAVAHSGSRPRRSPGSASPRHRRHQNTGPPMGPGKSPHAGKPLPPVRRPAPAQANRAIAPSHIPREKAPAKPAVATRGKKIPQLTVSNIRGSRTLPVPKAVSPGSQLVLDAISNQSGIARQRFLEVVTTQSAAMRQALESQQQKVADSGTAQHDRVQALTAQARSSILSQTSGAKSQLSSHGAAQTALLSGAQVTAISQLNAAFSAAGDRVTGLSNGYADRSLDTAAAAADQFNGKVEGAVNQAHETGRQKGNAGDSDSGVREAKRQAAEKVSSDTADKIAEGVDDGAASLRNSGPETAAEFRKQGAEAGSQLLAGQSQAGNQLTEAFTQAGSGIGQMTTGSLHSLDQAQAQMLDQLSSLEAKILLHLGQQIRQKLADFDTAGVTVMASFGQQSEKALGSADAQLSDITRRLAGVKIQENKAPAAVQLAGSQISPVFEGMNTQVVNSSHTLGDEVASKASEITSAFDSLTSTIGVQIQKFSSQANSGIQQSRQQAAGQLTQATAQTVTGGNSMVSQVSSSLGQQTESIDKGFQQALQGYGGALQDQVNQGDAKAKEPLGSLPGRIDQAQQKAAERAKRSWIENQLADAWEALSDPGFWAGLVVGLLLAVLFVALIAGTALTGGALLLVLVAGFAVIGALAAGIGSIVGQATNHSFTGGWDSSRIKWAEVGKAALIGAAAGAVFAVVAFVAVESFGVAAAGIGMIAIMSVTSVVVGIISNLVTGQPWDKGLVFNLLLGGLLALIGGKLSGGKGGGRPAVPGDPALPGPVPAEPGPVAPRPAEPVTPAPADPLPPAPRPVEPPAPKLVDPEPPAPKPVEPPAPKPVDPVPPGPQPVDPNPPVPKPVDPEPPSPIPVDPDPPAPKPVDPPAGRPRPERPIDPPRDAAGATDFNAWEARLRSKGVRGLPESEFTKKMNEARAGNQDTEAELRLAERYADAGYEVEIVRPTSETPAGETPPIVEPLSPDLRIKMPGETETARVDVKLREPGQPVTQKNLNNRIDKANDQLRSSQEGHGDVVYDGSEAAPGGLDQAGIERFLNGKMRGNRADATSRLRQVDYLEVIYPDGPLMKRSFMVRTADGNVNGPFTEILKR